MELPSRELEAEYSILVARECSGWYLTLFKQASSGTLLSRGQ